MAATEGFLAAENKAKDHQQLSFQELVKKKKIIHHKVPSTPSVRISTATKPGLVWSPAEHRRT